MALEENLAPEKNNASGHTDPFPKEVTEINETQKYVQILEGCADAVIIINDVGTISFFNRTAENLWGYRREEVIGENVRMLMPDTHSHSHDQYLSNYKHTRRAKVIGIGREVEALCQDGSTVPILLTLSEARLGNGSIYTAFIKDITEKKRLEQEVQNQLEQTRASEEELRQNMEELESTQEAMRKKELEMSGQLQAIDNTLATIEMDMQGHLLKANQTMQEILAYTEAELKGQHHSLIVEDSYAKSRDYLQFWNDLRKGKAQSGEFKQISSTGQEVWMQATYTPVFNQQGEPIKVISLASDITEQKQKSLDYASQLKSINETYATVEFEMDGTITSANPNFLNIVGYSGAELTGKHHSFMVSDEQKNSDDYQRFWADLRAGIPQSGEFKRVAKHGKIVWIKGSYAPILDLDGNPYKVVKYAQEITREKNLESELANQLEETRAQEEELRQNMEELQATQEKQARLSEELRVQQAEMDGQIKAINTAYAFIDFDPDGYILSANKIFLDLMGYSLEEIKGKHHRIFVDPDYARGPEYREFWRNLNDGHISMGTFKRIARNGDEVWLDASYAPVLDDEGKLVKVIKLAKDVTDFTVALSATSNFITEIQKGNFDVEMDLGKIRVKGELARMVAANTTLRDNLKKIVKELNRVVNLAGVEGRLSERLNLTHLDGAWKELIDSVNLLLTNISEPVLEINRIVTSLSLGDLTQQFKMEARGDIADMANALNIAIKNLNEFLVQIEESTLTVSTSSGEMLSKATSMRKSTTEASTAIQQMADGAQDQASRTDESSRLVEKTLNASLDMSKKAEIINTSAEKGQQNCVNGLEIIRTLVNNMADIDQSAGVTSGSIEVLTQRSEEISRILSVITDIAFQTKLLSVNANIEAARAGEAGRGFKVVADEINKLAEDSKNSTVEIDKVIKDVQKDILSTGDAIKNMKTSVESGKTATEQAEKVFVEINDSSTETLQSSKEILQGSQLQKQSIDQVVKNIEKIVVVSEETASGTQELASSSLEMDRGMAEISSSSEKLSILAEELKKRVNQFKLSKA